MSDDESSPFNLTFSSVRVITNPNDHYLDLDWQTILLSPLWAFEAVAAADQHPDEKERAAFAATLKAPPPGVFAAFVFAEVRKNLGALAVARANDSRTPLAGMADVRTLLARYPNEAEALEYRRALLELARNVANASGGGLFGRNRLNAAEAEAIGQLSKLLDVP